jgi:hypothetical protein
MSLNPNHLLNPTHARRGPYHNEPPPRKSAPTCLVVTPRVAPKREKGQNNEFGYHDLTNLPVARAITFTADELPEDSRCSCFRSTGNDQCKESSHYVYLIGTRRPSKEWKGPQRGMPVKPIAMDYDEGSWVICVEEDEAKG